MTELRKALPTKNGSEISRGNLILEVLNHFPQGLSMDELMAAAELRGHKESRQTFRRQIYYMAKTGRVGVQGGRVRPPLRSELDPMSPQVCPEDLP